MEHYQVILAYDGSQFKGFQRQANARSVQAVVETALRKLRWQGKSILAAGRTDTGVHATGQVIAFDLEWGHTTQELQQSLNSLLPSDIVAREVNRVKASFHPRYDAIWRRYLYRIYCQPVRDPLLDRYAWRVWPAADLDRLKEAARQLVGTYDYGAFGTPPHSGSTTVRTVLAAEWKQEAPYLMFEIAAQAYLYHMVRRLVFMQVRVAQGKLDLTDLRSALKPGSAGQVFEQSVAAPLKTQVHGLAPAHGLVLSEVHYPDEAVRYEEDTKKVEKSVDR